MDVVLLDGALGTELSRRGEDTAPPLWSARPLGAHPDAVLAIHRELLRAGAEVLTTCTFRTHERNLARAGWGGRSDELNRLAVALARRAIAAEGASGVRVAGSLSPLEDCFRPELVPPDEELMPEHAAQAQSLAGAGADVMLVETMATRGEAEAAVAAAVATGVPTWCSFTTAGDGRLLSGESLTDAARAVEGVGARAVLVNCVPAVVLAREVEVLRAAVSVAVGASGNIGHAPGVDGWRPELMLAPEAFAAAMLACRDAGATLLGGCCGTQPEHLAALARGLGRAPRPPAA